MIFEICSCKFEIPGVNLYCSNAYFYTCTYNLRITFISSNPVKYGLHHMNEIYIIDQNVRTYISQGIRMFSACK